MNATENSPLARKLAAFVALSEAELAVLETLLGRRRSFAAGRDLVHQGQSDQAAYILASGWVCSCKIQPDGSRQIVDFQIPGDFLGLRSVLLHTSDHSIEPIEYDADKGVDLLEEAGWYDRNGNGVADKDGVELDIEFLD